MKEDIEILISKFFSNSATDEEKKQLALWCNKSSENKSYFTELLSIWNATHPPFSPEKINTIEAYRAIASQISLHESSRKKLLLWWQKVAAFLLIPLLVSTSYLTFTSYRQHNLFSRQEVTAMPGTRTKVSLPDGSSVWLNSGSTLSYATPFNNKNREVNLSGEGYFSIKSDKKHPFSIATESLNVTVTGTELNVEAYPNDTTSTITLINGIASINLQGKESIDLSPGNQFIMNTSSSYKVNSVNTALYSKWRDGVLIFRDESLENIFKRIGRTFNTNIQIKNPQLSKQLYRATFKNESLTQILNALKLSAPIEYKYVEKNNQKGEIIEVYYKK